MGNDQSEYLTYKDVSQMIGCHERTIRRLVEKGEFPAPVKITGHARRFKRSLVQEWIDTREDEPEVPPKATFETEDDRVRAEQLARYQKYLEQTIIIKGDLFSKEGTTSKTLAKMSKKERAKHAIPFEEFINRSGKSFVADDFERFGPGEWIEIE